MLRYRTPLMSAALAVAVLLTPLAASAQEPAPDPAAAAAEQARQQADTAVPSTGGLVVTEYAMRRSKSSPTTIRVFGMIENQRAESVGVKTIAVSLFGTSGETLAAGSALSEVPSMLEPGTKAGWAVLIPDVPTTSEPTMKVQVESGPAASPYLPPITHDLRVEGVTVQPKSKTTFLARVVGQVVDGGQVAVDLPKVVLALAGPDGKLIDVVSAYSQLTTLEPGQSAPFAATVLNSPVDAPSVQHVYVEARVKR
jgi:hypothetical protein